MAEITRQDLISDDALEAPAILTKELEKLLSVVSQVKSSSKQMGEQLGGSGLKSSQEGTKKLTEEQRILAQVSKQIAAETAKQSEEYRKQAAVLSELKTQARERNALGEKEAINVRASNSSLRELEAALKANRAAYAALRSEEERASATGKQLSKAIDEQYSDVVRLNKGMGVHKDTVGNYEGALASLKAELKAARGEMVSIAETLGQSSKEYQDAAKRAGEIADKIADAKDEAKAFQGDTAIENLGTRFGLLGDKVRTLDFKGASTQIKGITELSKGLTFKETISGLGGVGSSLTSLGKALLTNPLFILAAVVIGIGVAIYKLKDSVKPLEIVFSAVGDSIDFVVQKLKDFSDWLGISSFAIDDKAKQVVESSKKEIDAISKRYDREIQLAESAGKDIIALEKQKNQEVVAKAAEGLNALMAKRREHNGKLTEEEQKTQDELYDIVAESNTRLQVLENKKNQEILKKALDERKKLQDKIRQIMRDFNDDFTEQQENLTFADPELLFGENPVEGVKSKLDEMFSAAKEAMKKEYDEEYEIKAKHDEKMFKSDMRYAENRRRVAIESLTSIQKIYEDFSGALLSLSSSLTAARVQDIDSEINKEKERANNEIILAGGNAAAKEQIQAQSNLRIAQLEKKKREEARKYAEMEKTAALIEAGIKTSLAILNQLSGGDPLTAIPRSILAGALGAIQIAAIAAKPLPQYFKGTDNHPGGLAVVGERGAELMFKPDGQINLTPSRATVLDLPKGTEVIPHAETMRMLAMAGIEKPDSIEGGKVDSRIINELKSLREVTAQNKPKHVTLTRNMAIVYESRKESETLTKKVRALSMGDWL